MSPEYEKIAETTMHYGFIPIKTPRISKEDRSLSQKFEDAMCGDSVQERMALLRLYVEHQLKEKGGPALFYYSKPFRKKKVQGHKFSLDIVGTNESIADALLIQATKACLEAEGFKKLIVDINSMGEKDTVSRFEKELSNYLRKHIENVPDKYTRNSIVY